MQVEQLREFLKKYHFKPNDLLGQNFLFNAEILEQIADAAELNSNDEVLEIGAGIGNLTSKLSERAGSVLSVEKDQRYFPILSDVLGDKLIPHNRTPKSSANVRLIFADVLSFNFQELLKPGYKVVANIPYYITGKIIEMLLAAKNKPTKIVLLVQKEVAERITAAAGDLSVLAISVQIFSEVRIAAPVPKEDFYPQPEVDSAVLVMDILPQPKFELDQKKFFRIVKAAFSGKRKQIHNTLRDNLGIEPKKLEQILKQSGVDPKSRPQELTLQQWHKLYDYLKF